MAENKKCHEVMAQNGMNCIEISFTKNKEYCQPPTEQNAKCKTMQNIKSSYPYPPWMPYKHILEHKMRKFNKSCTEDLIEHLCKIKCEDKSAVTQMEGNKRRISPIWNRLLHHLFARYCSKFHNECKAQDVNNIKFTSYANRNCCIALRYQEVTGIPAPGWEPRRRFRGLTPP